MKIWKLEFNRSKHTGNQKYIAATRKDVEKFADQEGCFACMRRVETIPQEGEYSIESSEYFLIRE